VALLHDIGKIIIEGIEPSLYKEMQSLVFEKNIAYEVLEDLLGGYYHNIVGYLLAKKWNFPPIVCEVVKFHHSPRESDGFFNETFLIYLSNILTHFHDKQLIYENIDENVLSFFEIIGKEELYRLVDFLETEYTKDML